MRAQFEAWLSLQAVSARGLSPAQEGKRRCKVEPTFNATAEDGARLLRMWKDKSPWQAYDLLSLPDVTVTNQKDKSVQLAKLLRLNDEVMSETSLSASAQQATVVVA